MSSSRLPECVDDGDLVVRRWTVDDAPVLHDAIVKNTEHLRDWLPWIAFEPRTIEQRIELLIQWEADWRTGGSIPMGIFLDGAVVGSTGLHRRIAPDGVEIGYWIDRDHLGRGLAVRASRLLTTAAFTVPGITHVEIRCDQANAASRRIPEKLGFAHVGDLPDDSTVPAASGTHCVYRVTRDDWQPR